MLTRFALVPRHISTRRNISSSIIRPPCQAQQTLKLLRTTTCLYMRISRRQCTLLCVLDFHRNSLFQVELTVCLYSDLDNRQPSPPVTKSQDYSARSACLHFCMALRSEMNHFFCIYALMNFSVVTRPSYRFQSPKLPVLYAYHLTSSLLALYIALNL